MEKIKHFKYYWLIRNILKFEIFYKLIILFFISPVMRKVLQEYLSSVSSGIVFNQDIILSFLSLKGIVVFLLLTVTLIFIVYYEIYVVINIISLEKQEKKYSLRRIMLKSFMNLKSLHYLSIGLTGIYFLLLLPLVHIGYLNSYIARWDIPPFIFGELKLTYVGNAFILIVYVVYYSLYLLLIFVPIYMVLKHHSFITATKQSFSLIKKINMNEKIKLLTCVAVWIIVEYFIHFLLSYPILKNRDFNWYFLKYFINSESFRYSALQYIFLYFLAMIAMLCFLRMLINLVYKYETELITVDDLPIETEHMNQSITNFITFIKEIYIHIKNRLAHIQFYKNHKRLSQISIIGIVLCLISIYLQADALFHRPWVIGHRGSGYQVENTLEAVKDANDSKVDYAEIDIQLSSDNVPVVFHDMYLSRLSQKTGKVSDYTAEELEKIELSQNGYVAHIITLDHLIKEMKSKKMTVGLLIELKPTDNNGSEMAKQIIQVIKDNNFSKQAIFMSLDYESAQAIKRAEPLWWVGYCIYGSIGDIDESIWEMDIDFLAIEENRASTAFIQKATKQMIPVYIWTVDQTKKMKQYLDMGVCGLITNYPDLGKVVVDEYEKKGFHYYYYDGKGYPKKYLEVKEDRLI